MFSPNLYMRHKMYKHNMKRGVNYDVWTILAGLSSAGVYQAAHVGPEATVLGACTPAVLGADVAAQTVLVVGVNNS